MAYSIVLQKSPCTAHTWGVESCAPPSWGWRIGIKYLEFFCMWDLSILPHLFIFFFNRVCMLLWTCGYLLYTSVYNPILFNLSCCSNCSSSGHWEPFRLAPGSLWYTLIIVDFLGCTSLLSKSPRCSRFISCIPFPHPRINHFCKDHLLFWVCVLCVVHQFPLTSVWRPLLALPSAVASALRSFLLPGLLLLISCWLGIWGPINQSHA